MSRTNHILQGLYFRLALLYVQLQLFFNCVCIKLLYLVFLLPDQFFPPYKVDLSQDFNKKIYINYAYADFERITNKLQVFLYLFWEEDHAENPFGPGANLNILREIMKFNKLSLQFCETNLTPPTRTETHFLKHIKYNGAVFVDVYGGNQKSIPYGHLSYL